MYRMESAAGKSIVKYAILFEARNMYFVLFPQFCVSSFCALFPICRLFYDTDDFIGVSANLMCYVNECLIINKY